MRYYGLDLARALAIILVLVAHGAAFWAPITGNRLFDPNGVLRVTAFSGVELFYSLSGFLIGALLLDIQQRNPSKAAVRVFLLRRWMRTLPLYYVVLIAFLLFPQIEPHLQIRVWSFALLVQNLITPMPLTEWYAPSWSLTIEEWSYIALPPLAFYACRRAKNPVACAAFILIAIGMAGRITVGLMHDHWSGDLLDRLMTKVAILRSDAIAYGVLGAVIVEHNKHLFALGAAIIGTALLAISTWIVYTASYYEEAYGIMGWLLLFPMTAIGFTMLLPWLKDMARPRIMIARPVQFLARISYALYLTHWPFIYLATGFRPSLRLPVYIGGSLLAAVILSYGIEYPIMDRRPKQTRSRASVPPPR